MLTGAATSSGAVRRNRLVKGTVTRTEIETVVKLWLRYAKDRSGVRQVRKQQSTSKRQIIDNLSDVESRLAIRRADV
jgi:hypothetical protein